jgi:hypothetical protein
VSTIEYHKTCSAQVISSCIKIPVKVQFLTSELCVAQCTIWIVCSCAYFGSLGLDVPLWVSRVQCSISFGFLYCIGSEVSP